MAAMEELTAMVRHLFALALAVFLLVLTCVSQPQPAERAVDLTASDGTKLKATYFAAGQPGPGGLRLG